MSDDISTAVGLTIVLFAGLSLILGLLGPAQGRSSVWLRGVTAAGRLAMLGYGLLILLNGTTGYEAPILQTGLLMAFALSAITSVVMDRRTRSDDKHR